MHRRILFLATAICAFACGSNGGGSAGDHGDDAATDAAASSDTSTSQETGSPEASGSDAVSDAGPDAESDADADADADAEPDAVADSASAADAAADAAADSASVSDAASETGGPPDASDGSTTVGPITGGPCSSGAPGATAIRIEFIDAAGTADVQWLVEGDPDRSNDSAGTYGYTIPFTASYVDMFLGQGGVALDDSDFIDVGLSTVGLTSITSATLSIFGRSYDVTTNGSFNWQTFDGTGQTATDFVSNVPPYQWYSANMTTEIAPGENNVLVRIKAGPSSDSLVVNQVEICLVAQ